MDPNQQNQNQPAAPAENPAPTEMQNPAPSAFPTSPAPANGGDHIPVPALAKKSHKKLIIALAAGIGGFLVLAAIITVVIILVLNSGKINSVDELKSAIKDHKAANCQFDATVDGNSMKYTLQANDSWSKAHIKVNDSVEIWEVQNGAKTTAYMTMSFLGKSINLKQDGKTSDIRKQIGANDDSSKLKDIKNLKCDANSKADFAVPSRDWKSSASTFGSSTGGDESDSTDSDSSDSSDDFGDSSDDSSSYTNDREDGGRNKTVNATILNQ